VKFSLGDLNPDPYPHTPRTFNLWSDHHIKGVRW